MKLWFTESKTVHCRTRISHTLLAMCNLEFPISLMLSCAGNLSTERNLRKTAGAQSQLWQPESKQPFVLVRCCKDQIFKEN